MELVYRCRFQTLAPQQLHFGEVAAGTSPVTMILKSAKWSDSVDDKRVSQQTCAQDYEKQQKRLLNGDRFPRRHDKRQNDCSKPADIEQR
jgi:hypothetical protein